MYEQPSAAGGKAALQEQPDAMPVKKMSPEQSHASDEKTAPSERPAVSATAWRNFISLLKIGKPAKKILVFAAALSLLEAAAGLVVPLFARDFINRFADIGFSAALIAGLVAAFVMQALAGGVAHYLLNATGERIVAGIRRRLWGHALELPVAYYDKHESGELMSRITQDTSAIKTLVASHLGTFVSGIVSIAGAVILLFVMDWRMTVILLSAIPLSMLVLVPFGRKIYRISLQAQDEMAGFSANLGRVLSEIRLVKASNAQAPERKRGGLQIDNLLRFGLKEAVVQAVVAPVMTTVILIVFVVIIGYGGARVASGDLLAGTLVAILIYLFQIITPFTMMASFFTAFQKAMGASERIQELLNTAGERASGLEGGASDSDASGDGRVPSPEDRTRDRNASGRHAPLPAVAAADSGEILSRHRSGSPGGSTAALTEHGVKPDFSRPLVFEDVSFGYDADKKILTNVRFTVFPGQTVAFVGPSGAGKTTVFSLIERFYLPTDGQIRLGDTDISAISLPQWRCEIGYVSQDSPLMSGTIRENICYGIERPISDRELAEAAELANAAEFVAKLPQGFDTEVGERGVRLSGGQRQRIAIARALLRNPRLLLLDEATSNLDSESEALVQHALQNLKKDRTTLVIAHRLSTVFEADQILVLERGTVTGSGTHEQLLSGHPLYRKLVRQQMKAALPANDGEEPEVEAAEIKVPEIP
ncbi:ABC transporter ATP-binding protein [Cohnella massiliensis]|uniref:ABC transporter ATP-binding protein n=1 Tax=Cohnella massiliensis TaxID=1816691 RepID=UPI001FE37A68|nr:ABC transporter ATP-binding protein [Cohnella massiliensis]